MDRCHPRGGRDAKPALRAHGAPAPDCVLLRLRTGDAARLDAACRAAGQNRSRFCRERMIDLLAALAPRLAEIDEAGGLDAVLARGLGKSAVVAAEFDALFGAS